MGIQYPGNPPGSGFDTFTTPTSPESTPLSEAGTGTRNLVQSVQDEGSAIEELEQWAALRTHDHSGDGTSVATGAKLAQANTHQNVDTDAATSSIHHTIGSGATQAAPGNHVHDYNGPTITHVPHKICTSTTRPTDPEVGMTIWETDTNCARVWAAFPGNTLTSGMSYTDLFNRTSPVVAYDNTGSGAVGIPVNTLTGNHTVGANAGILIVTVTVFNTSRPAHTSWNVTATLGTSTPMTQVMAIDNGGSLTGFAAIFTLLDPPPGLTNININASPIGGGSFPAAMSMASVSYNNVGAIGPIYSAGSNLAIGMQLTVPSSPGEMVFGVFTGGLGGMSAPSGTQRIYSYPGPSYDSLLIEDAQGGYVPTNIGCQNQAFSGAAVAFNLIVKSSTLGANYNQAYVTGNATGGSLATPVSNAMTWMAGQNVTARIIATPTASGGTVTQSDNQDFTFTTGTAMSPGWNSKSATIDVYSRVSSNGQTYTRLSLNNNGANLYYTSTGPSGEQSLGSVFTGTQSTNIPWEYKITGQQFLLYRGGVQVMSIVDSQNVTAKGANYRGWLIGASACPGQYSQLMPPTVASFKVNDLPLYSTQNIWQLLSWGSVPYIRAETHVGQQIVVGDPVAAYFDTLLEDFWGFFGMGSIGIVTTVPPVTDCVITESGHYDVHASIPWDPNYYDFDQAMLSFTVNGQDIGRKSQQFMRGHGFAPGFPQTLECSFNWKFAKGDVLRVMASHNSDSTAWLYFDSSPAAKYAVSFDLRFTGP